MARDLWGCKRCGHAETLPETSERTGEGKPCPSCGAPLSEFERIPYTSGYDRPHLVNIWVRAHDLERVAGVEHVRPELEAALERASEDPDNPDELRALVAFLEQRLHEMSIAGAPREAIIAKAEEFLGQGDPSNLRDSAEQDKFSKSEDRVLTAALNQLWMNREYDDDIRFHEGRAVQIGVYVLYVYDDGFLMHEQFHTADAASVKVCELVEEFERGGDPEGGDRQ